MANLLHFKIVEKVEPKFHTPKQKEREEKLLAVSMETLNNFWIGYST